jgi:hypothetical protein
VNARLFWKSLAVQAVLVAIPFAVLGLALDKDFSAIAGGVAGAIVMLASSHLPGMGAALLVFAASCGSYDPDAEEQARREWEAEKAAKAAAKR